ncbi:hypothetical protein ACPA9J_14450 [Pseudomonas aeruginosa]
MPAAVSACCSTTATRNLLPDLYGHARAGKHLVLIDPEWGGREAGHRRRDAPGRAGQRTSARGRAGQARLALDFERRATAARRRRTAT